MHTFPCQNADQMSNSIDHYQTVPDLGVHCLLRYISVPYNVLVCSKCDKYNNILISLFLTSNKENKHSLHVGAL